MTQLFETERTRIRRVPLRAVHEREALNRIIDECIVCHVGIVQHGRPVVIPTFGWRGGGELFLHGSRGSRLLKHMAAGEDICVTFTILDGLVMARSAFHHSANYRSAVIFGTAGLIDGREDRLDALQLFMEQIAPGRWQSLREVNEKELAATDVLKMSLDEASVKIRSGDPGDDEQDLDFPVWAGILPIRQVVGPAVDAENNLTGQTAPDFSAVFADRWYKP